MGLLYRVWLSRPTTRFSRPAAPTAERERRANFMHIDLSIHRWYLTISLALILSACSAKPEEVYRGYGGPDLPNASLVTVNLKNRAIEWVECNDLRVDGKQYGAIKLLPGTYRIRYRATFAVSYAIDSRGRVSREVTATVVLKAGHTYELRAERTTGHGYKLFFWIEDVQETSIIWGEKKPSDRDL